MQLEFDITNQQLERKDDNVIVNMTVKHVTCQFNFQTDDWVDADKYVIFKNEGTNNYCVPLGDESTATCTVPGAVLEHDFFRLTIFGIKGDERITTTEKTLLLDRSGFTKDLQPVDPNESGDIFSTN